MKYKNNWSEFYEKNMLWSERITGILDTYAMLLRRKEEYSISRECVDGWCTKVLDIYRNHIECKNFSNQYDKFNAQSCFNNLKYKYLVVKFNLCMNMNDLESISAIDIKNAMKLELELGMYERDEYQYAQIIEPFDTISGRANLQSLSNIDDTILADLFKFSMIKFVPRSVTGLSLTKYPIPSNDTNKAKVTKSNDERKAQIVEEKILILNYLKKLKETNQ